jgi:protein TonB
MFDTIGVSQRTRKPWTVVSSFIGQVAMVGLAIVIPMLSTEGLPHRLGWVGLPEPPRGLPHRPAPSAAARTNTMPSQVYRRTLIVPVAIPARAMAIVDPAAAPALDTDGSGGVAGGIGAPGGSGGNGVIDSLGQAVAVAPPPPPPVRREPSKVIPRVSIGGKVQAAKLLSGPAPVYPVLARQARISGVVRLEAIISRDGTIMDLRAVSGHPLLIPAALAAVERWVFRPTYLNGEPVEVATQIEVNFALQR